MRRDKEFSARIREYYQLCFDYTGRRYSQEKLAEALVMDPGDLSRKLTNGKRGRLTDMQIRAIVKILAEWQAIRSQAQACELLGMMDCPPFSPADWAVPPLAHLAKTNGVTEPQMPSASQSVSTSHRELHAATLLLTGQPPITSLAWSPDARYLAYADTDGHIYVVTAQITE